MTRGLGKRWITCSKGLRRCLADCVVGALSLVALLTTARASLGQVSPPAQQGSLPGLFVSSPPAKAGGKDSQKTTLGWRSPYRIAEAAGLHCGPASPNDQSPGDPSRVIFTCRANPPLGPAVGVLGSQLSNQLTVVRADLYYKDFGLASALLYLDRRTDVDLARKILGAIPSVRVTTDRLRAPMPGDRSVIYQVGNVEAEVFGRAAGAGGGFIELNPDTAASPQQQPPRVIESSRVAPDYPEVARRAKVQGTVILRVLVDSKGLVVSTHVVKGLALGLDARAAEAVKKWRFDPADCNGKPCSGSLDVEIPFVLP
jgi:TonB family protein